MSQTAPRPTEPATAPQDFRDALAQLVQIGLKVARMVGYTADAETELAEAASQAGVAEGVSPLANSLAEAIEADRAAAAAAETRHSVVARTQAVATAYAETSRGMRLTVMLAEHLDRGWARGGDADDRPAMLRRQIARGVADAIGHAVQAERPDRLERLDREAGIGDRPTAEIIAEICRAFGLDLTRMTLRTPLSKLINPVERDQRDHPTPPPTAGSPAWNAGPPQRQPDG